MAKPLRDIASKAPKEGKLSGVKKSTTEPEDISDFNASSGNQDFAKDHKVEKHSDRVGNDDDVYKGKTKKAEMQRHGYKKPQDAKIYEAKCNMTEAGTMCEVHGDKACSSDKVPEAGVGKRGMIADKKKLNEVLNKKSIRIVEISDALALSIARGALKSMNDADVNTDKGLATFQKRTKTQAMALDKMNPDYKRLKAKVGTSDANAKDAAYRDAVKEENINEITKKKKTQKESAPGDTPIRMPSGNVGDSDTGRI
jgi:hypothetical protein